MKNYYCVLGNGNEEVKIVFKAMSDTLAKDFANSLCNRYTAEYSDVSSQSYIIANKLAYDKNVIACQTKVKQSRMKIVKFGLLAPMTTSVSHSEPLKNLLNNLVAPLIATDDRLKVVYQTLLIAFIQRDEEELKQYFEDTDKVGWYIDENSEVRESVEDYLLTYVLDNEDYKVIINMVAHGQLGEKEWAILKYVD